MESFKSTFIIVLSAITSAACVNEHQFHASPIDPEAGEDESIDPSLDPQSEEGNTAATTSTTTNSDGSDHSPENIQDEKDPQCNGAACEQQEEGPFAVLGSEDCMAVDDDKSLLNDSISFEAQDGAVAVRYSYFHRGSGQLKITRRMAPTDCAVSDAGEVLLVDERVGLSTTEWFVDEGLTNGTAVTYCIFFGDDVLKHAGTRTVVPMAAPTEGPGSIRWESTFDGRIRDMTLRADGALLAAAADKVAAIDVETGAELWRYTVDEGRTIGSMSKVDESGLIYLGVGKGEHSLMALDAETGLVQWSTLLKNQTYEDEIMHVSSVPLSYGGKIFVGTRTGGVCNEPHSGGAMYAVDGLSGAIEWAVELGDWVSSDPIVGLDDTIYVGSNDYNFYAFDAQSGQIRWQFAAGDQISAQRALLYSSFAYFGSFDGNMYSLNAADGALEWTYDSGYEVSGSVEMGTGNNLYLPTKDQSLRAIDSTSGCLLWQAHVPGGMRSKPVVGTDGTVYAVGARSIGTLYAFDHLTGVSKWHRPVGQSEPLPYRYRPLAQDDDTLYLGDAKVTAFWK